MTNTHERHGWAAMTLAAIFSVLAAASTVPAQTFSILHTFKGGVDGANPTAGLIPDPAGNIYGTTDNGGDPVCGCGVVFKLDAAGSETVMHSFTGAPDGAHPLAGLLADTAGNLYGATFNGGTGSCFNGCGIVFRLDAAGNETVLHNFTGTDGANPQAGLVRDAAGNLYGATALGGSCPDPSGCGVMFRMDPAGNETVLHSFTGGADGAFPYATLTMDPAGDLYGTAGGGGLFGLGVIFKLDPAGNETVLHNFTGGVGGWDCSGGLTQDAAGNLYGALGEGGTAGSFGLVYEIDPTLNYTVLHSFTGGIQGALVESALIRDPAGNLYGTANQGGSFTGVCNVGSGCGVVFEVSPTGKEKELHVFSGGADGANPFAPLLQFDGALYGTTTAGGKGGGVVFKIALR